MEQEIIELKFDGNGIKPSIVKASEIAELLISFENSILNVLKETNPELNKDFVFISFDQVIENCLLLKYMAHKAQQYVIPAYLLITNSFSSNNFNQLPNSTIEELRCITRFAQKYNCEGSFLQNGQTLTSFKPDCKIEYNHLDGIRGETTIYGELQKAGGENPRVTLKLNDYTLSFDVKREIAIELAPHLYKEVGLKGIANWDKKTYRILDFKAEGVVLFDRDTPLTDTFKELHELFGDYLNDENVNQYIN